MSGIYWFKGDPDPPLDLTGLRVTGEVTFTAALGGVDWLSELIGDVPPRELARWEDDGGCLVER
jgi:hypothetical protein